MLTYAPVTALRFAKEAFLESTTIERAEDHDDP
jgi:hypothetical protein